MALLSVKARKRRFEYLGIKYTKAGIKKLQKMYFKNEELVDGVYGPMTDILLRHVYNVKKYAPNFTPEEFKCECGGRYCNGYPSFMKQVELKNLQSIRNHYKKPMIVTCGLRCTRYNASLRGSVQNSGHLTGYACDFYQAGITDTLANRKASIKWMKKLPNTKYIYGNGINSNGYSVFAPYMGNAMHYETKKPEKSPGKKPAKKSPYYSDHVIIGQACCNEKGTLSGGKPGDQTGREVCMGNWYSGGWLYLFRATDVNMRNKLAQAMIDTCNNQNIGYNVDIPNRYAAWDNAEANGHNIKAISKKGDTTCSQAVSMCMRAVGIQKKYAPRHMDIATMTKVMLASPFFKCYRSSAYTQSSKNLLPGDILLSSHHTLIVVKSPNAK